VTWLIHMCVTLIICKLPPFHLWTKHANELCHTHHARKRLDFKQLRLPLPNLNQFSRECPCNCTQVFTGVPKISKKKLRSKRESHLSNGNPLRSGHAHIGWLRLVGSIQL